MFRSLYNKVPEHFLETLRIEYGANNKAISWRQMNPYDCKSFDIVCPAPNIAVEKWTKGQINKAIYIFSLNCKMFKCGNGFII